jgi:thioredoxin 1
MTFSAPLHTSEQSIDRVLRAGPPVLLVFERRECAPCRDLEPALNQLAAEFAGRVLVARVDAQDNPGLVRRYRIARLPELVFIRDQAEQARAQGAPTAAALRGWIQDMLAGGRPPAPGGPSVPLSGAPARSAPPPVRTRSRPAEQAASAGGPVILTDATFDQVVNGSATPVLVDFWAPWCGPCRAVAPAVEQLAREFAGRAVVAKLNVDENPATAQRFGISGIPALLIFRRGQVAERLVGAQPASVLRQALARHVAG